MVGAGRLYSIIVHSNKGVLHGRCGHQDTSQKESLKGLAEKALHKHCILLFWQGPNLILLMGSYPIQCSDCFCTPLPYPQLHRAQYSIEFDTQPRVTLNFRFSCLHFHQVLRSETHAATPRLHSVTDRTQDFMSARQSTNRMASSASTLSCIALPPSYSRLTHST